MSSFAEKIKNTDTAQNAVIFFMGQAGFIIKDKAGKLYVADVYFSDCCEREFGFKRLIPKILSADELVFDYVLTTHGHYDHFDVDAMPALMGNSVTQLYTTQDGIEECEKLGITERVNKIELEGSYQIGNISLDAIYCDHGELAPHAVGFLLKIDGKKVLLAGDTSYHPEKAQLLTDEKIDVAFVPINGAFGNMNESEAAQYTKIVAPRKVVPCHYGNFKEHGGDVQKFNKELARIEEKVENINLTIGDILEL